MSLLSNNRFPSTPAPLAPTPAPVPTHQQQPPQQQRPSTVPQAAADGGAPAPEPKK